MRATNTNVSSGGTQRAAAFTSDSNNNATQLEVAAAEAEAEAALAAETETEAEVVTAATRTTLTVTATTTMNTLSANTNGSGAGSQGNGNGGGGGSTANASTAGSTGGSGGGGGGGGLLDEVGGDASSRRQATRVFKKSSSNGKITVYLGKRDFVDHVTHVDPIDGVVFIDPEYVKDRKVFGQVLAAFRYGREDLDVLGLTFRKDLYLAHEQIYPPMQLERPMTRLQERLIKKLGPNAHPFYFEVPPYCPASVSLQPAPGDVGKSCGVDYELKAFVGEFLSDLRVCVCMTDLFKSESLMGSACILIDTDTYAHVYVCVCNQSKACVLAEAHVSRAGLINPTASTAQNVIVCVCCCC